MIPSSRKRKRDLTPERIIRSLPKHDSPAQVILSMLPQVHLHPVCDPMTKKVVEYHPFVDSLYEYVCLGAITRGIMSFKFFQEKYWIMIGLPYQEIDQIGRRIRLNIQERGKKRNFELTEIILSGRYLDDDGETIIEKSSPRTVFVRVIGRGIAQELVSCYGRTPIIDLTDRIKIKIK